MLAVNSPAQPDVHKYDLFQLCAFQQMSAFLFVTLDLPKCFAKNLEDEDI